MGHVCLLKSAFYISEMFSESISLTTTTPPPDDVSFSADSPGVFVKETSTQLKNHQQHDQALTSMPRMKNGYIKPADIGLWKMLKNLFCSLVVR